MTVSRGAAGKAMVMFISNIWSRSTKKGGANRYQINTKWILEVQLYNSLVYI